MSLSKKYAWYIENGQVAIIETSTTGDTAWQAVSTSGLTFKMLAEIQATDFDTDLTDSSKTNNLPNRFRRVIADLVISKGYEIPPNIELKMAGHFYNKYIKRLRDMKKTKNRRFQSQGHISGWYY